MATIVYALLGIPLMLLFLSTIGNLLSRGLKSLYRLVVCTWCCSSSRSSSLSSMNKSKALPFGGGEYSDHRHSSLPHHHHHAHHQDDDDDNYQVHHIALDNINSLPCDNSGTGNVSLLNHHVSTPKSTTKFATLNSNYRQRCSYGETGIPGVYTDNPALDTSKLCSESSIDHLYPTSSNGPANECNHHHHSLRLGSSNDQPTFYGTSNQGQASSSLKSNHHSHLSLANSLATEDSNSLDTPLATITANSGVGGQCDNIPFYLCFLLIIVYTLAGAAMLHFWESWPWLDGAYFCFVTLRYPSSMTPTMIYCSFYGPLMLTVHGRTCEL